MKPAEVRELTDDEIRARIEQLEEERFRLRFRSATQQLENPMLLRHIRQDISRLRTVLHERNQESRR
ncbi:MAG TPA: 50S ribosomal protein L29 [Longimicrobium sp.]|nr:50S ribosomal protein L29 [Longimicrobium sp.]